MEVGWRRVVNTINEMVPMSYPSRYWTWQAGLSFATSGNRLRISYSYERRNYITDGTYLALLSTDVSHSHAYVPERKSDLHHLDVRWKVLEGKGAKWETGMTVTGLRSKQYIHLPDSIYFPVVATYYVVNPTGDMAPSAMSWTGGWVNRVRVGAFDAGFDLLYHFGERIYTTPYGTSGSSYRLNSVMTPTLYLGYRWKAMEVFIQSRGLARSKSSDLPDNRRYYTVGVTMGL
jgi:hypothetical protein